MPERVKRGEPLRPRLMTPEKLCQVLESNEHRFASETEIEALERRRAERYAASFQIKSLCDRVRALEAELHRLKDGGQE